ncbi:ATP cone domain-containing protein [Clostridium sp.]|uniref:ATP cone domain-containing protein n=1 Tax=Clostridium sp. TaxID=1506 RepID=UPI003F2A63D2
MKIIKKDGRVEEFNINKIKTSIDNAAKDVQVYLNESDLDILTRDVVGSLKSIKRNEIITSSYEVMGVIFTILKRDGFNSVLKSYFYFLK